MKFLIAISILMFAGQASANCRGGDLKGGKAANCKRGENELAPSTLATEKTRKMVLQEIDAILGPRDTAATDAKSTDSHR